MFCGWKNHELPSALQEWLKTWELLFTFGSNPPVTTKADGDYVKALEQVDRSRHRDSWRAFQRQNGRSLVRTLHVDRGELVCDVPLTVHGLDIETLAQGQELGHALVTALATLDVNHMLQSIQTHSQDVVIE